MLSYPFVASQLAGLEPARFGSVDQVPRANYLRLRPLRVPHFTPIHTFCTRMVRVWYERCDRSGAKSEARSERIAGGGRRSVAGEPMPIRANRTVLGSQQ